MDESIVTILARQEHMVKNKATLAAYIKFECNR